MFITSIIILLPIIGYMLDYRYATKEYDKALLLEVLKSECIKFV